MNPTGFEFLNFRTFSTLITLSKLIYCIKVLKYNLLKTQSSTYIHKSQAYSHIHIIKTFI